MACDLEAQLSFQGSPGAISQGLAGTGSTLHGIDAIFNNQAGLTNIDNFSFIISTQTNFNIQSLTGVGAGIAIPIKENGVFGLSASTFGFDSYREQKIGLVYARSLYSNFDLAAQFDLLNVSITNFGNRTTGTFELGFMTKFGSKFTIGGHIFSPVSISITEEDNDVNSRIRIGGTYAPSEKVKVHLELDKFLQNPLSIRGGFEYAITPKIGLRLGMSSNPVFYSVGLSYNIREKFAIDGAYSINPNLGGSPALTLKSDNQ